MKFKELAESSTLSVGLLVLIIVGLWNVIPYFSKTDANAKAIDEIKATITQRSQVRDEVLRSIDTRLSRIEGALEIGKKEK